MEDTLEVVKNKDGFWVVKGLDISGFPAVKWYTGYRFRDQPEVVVHMCDKFPALKEHIDYEWYKKWERALSQTESIKRGGRFKFNHDFKVEPFPHQKKALAFSLKVPAAALFMEQGTGKTLTALLAAEIRDVKTLIICPKSVMYSGWYEDARNLTHLDPMLIRKKSMRWYNPEKDVLHLKWKPGYDKRLKQNDYKTIEEQVASPYKAHVVGMNYFAYHYEKFLDQGYEMVIIDESSMVKGRGRNFQAVREIVNQCKYRLILTGTPTANGVEDLWGQMKCLDNSLEDTWGDFEGRYYWKHPTITYFTKERPGAAEAVMGRIEDRCIRMRAEDVLDLPEHYVDIVKMEPEEKIRSKYKEFLDNKIAFLKSHRVEAYNPLTEMLRLHQLINGYVTDGEDIHPYCKPMGKLNKVEEIVRNSPDKAIVWAIYRNDFNWLREQLAEFNPAVINGQTKDLEEEEDRFKHNNRCKVMIAHPKSCMFGHTWTVASRTIFYTYSFSLIDYLQARKRNHRLGMDREVYEYILSYGGIEDHIGKSLSRKQDVAEIKLNLLDI